MRRSTREMQRLQRVRLMTNRVVLLLQLMNQPRNVLRHLAPLLAWLLHFGF